MVKRVQLLLTGACDTLPRYAYGVVIETCADLSALGGEK